MLDQASITAPARAPACDKKLSLDVFGALINLSGRRRFTSQRVVLYAVLASMGHEGALATAGDTLNLFRDAHQTLVYGKGRFPGMFCAQLEEAHFGALQGERAIGEFIVLAKNTLAAIAENGRAAPALLDELVRSGTPLLSVLNCLTLVYEEQAMRHAQVHRRQLHDMMDEIKSAARQARKLALHAEVVAARAGEAGKEFSVAAGRVSRVSADIDDLVHRALRRTLSY